MLHRYSYWPSEEVCSSSSIFTFWRELIKILMFVALEVHLWSIVFRMLVKRSIVNYIGVTLYICSVKYMPLGIANALHNTSPIMAFFIELCYYKKVCFLVNLGQNIMAELGHHFGVLHGHTLHHPALIPVHEQRSRGNRRQHPQYILLFRFDCSIHKLTVHDFPSRSQR